MIKSVNCLPSGLVETVEEMKRKMGRTKSRRREGKAIAKAERNRERECGVERRKHKGRPTRKWLTKALKESGKGKGRELVGFGIWRAR